MSPPEPPRTLRLRLDEDALAGNWRALDRMSGKAATGAAVKADCYGLGVARCVPVLAAVGARDFFVAHFSEVAALLGHVPAAQVSVLHGPLTPDDVEFAKSTGVRPVINSLRQARLWLDGGGGICDLMVDTGINRLGLPMSDIGDPTIARLEIDILMSHLASADEDVALNQIQLERFNQASASLTARRFSLANSAGVALGTDFAFDLTRPGLSLYGGVQRPELQSKIAQVGFPEAAIIQVRQVEQGDGIGYNSLFVADRTMRVGTVSIGYADGMLRCWGGKGWLEHDGRKLTLLGKVSMDMVAVDLEFAPDLKEGDWASLPYNLPEAAGITGLSQYELLTLLGARFAR